MAEYDRLLYEEEEEKEERGSKTETGIEMCAKQEVGLLLLEIAKHIVDALNASIKIIIDVETIQYESALSLLSQLVYCSSYWKRFLSIKDKTSNDYILLNFSMYVITRAKSTVSTINVVFDMERKREELMEKVETVLSTPNVMYFAVLSKPPEVTFTTALYRTNILYKAVRNMLIALDMKYSSVTNEYAEKFKYVGRVPYELCVFGSLDVVKKIAETWAPPPPANATYLSEQYRPLDSLVLNEEFKTMLKHYMSVVQDELRGSLLLVGLPGSGRKTIARSISGELGIPAYHISIANVLSRYVGESESKLKAFFESMRARGGLAVFENVETLFRESGSESVTPNLRSILFQEMSREDNNFIIVFTANEDAPTQVFDTPYLGELKAVIPLPDWKGRQMLARMFLREIMGSDWEKALAVTKKFIKRNDDAEAENTLYAFYADTFVSPSVGFTPGELYMVMRLVLRPAIRYIFQKEHLIPVVNQITKYTQRDLSARQAKIRQLIKRAEALGQYIVVDALQKIYDELMKVSMEKERKSTT